MVERDGSAREYTAILEYQLPLESRRPDVVILLPGPVAVIELKGKSGATQADIDQVAAYARDLRCYHRECADRPVHAILVPMRAGKSVSKRDGVHIVGPDGLDEVVEGLVREDPRPPITAEAFLRHDAYRPLPTLVRAARELVLERKVREIWRARAATEPAVEAIAQIAHEAARTRTRHLVLVTGAPGSGKTLVGMRAVHAEHLDDLAVPRANGMPTAPGIYLSGNGPLVTVLQYELREAGGGGRVFVRGVKDYLDFYAPKKDRIPEQHLLVFDEAQRAFDAAMVGEKHPHWTPQSIRSEPQLFVELCERVPEWCVMVGLIGEGQEINKGEEGGLIQWRTALEGCRDSLSWTVHGPHAMQQVFANGPYNICYDSALNLDTVIRFHLVPRLHEFVNKLLNGSPTEDIRPLGQYLQSPSPDMPGGIRLWITRDLDAAAKYLRGRYTEDSQARFGLVASSKDKVLEKRFGVRNSFMATNRVNLGAWYSGDESDSRSCRHLEDVVTEFGAQGLELDMALLAWGTDLIRENGEWSTRHAGGYKGSRVPVKDAYQLRVNAYRVLLTRGRDGTVVFMPPLKELDETWEYLTACGFRELVQGERDA